MQYASASRRDGLGALLKAKGLEDRGTYRFDRIEQVMTPTIQRLLVAFRREKLPVIYLTVGSELPDFGDMLPGMRRFAQRYRQYRGRQGASHPGRIGAVAGRSRRQQDDHERLPLLRFRAPHAGNGTRTALLHRVATSSCVEGTARDAADRGFQCVIVEDGCGAASRELHDAACRNFAHCSAVWPRQERSWPSLA